MYTGYASYTKYTMVSGAPHFFWGTRRMHKQCVPGPLLSFVGPGNEASAILNVAPPIVGVVRVSNRNSRSMQNEFISVFSCRPTLGKIETTPQIGYALGKVHENAKLNHQHKYKKWLRDQHHAHRGRSTS